MGEPVPPYLQGPCPDCIDLLPETLHATMIVPGVMSCEGNLEKYGVNTWLGVLSCTGDGFCEIYVAYCSGDGIRYNNAGVESLTWQRYEPPPPLEGACGVCECWGAGCLPLTGFTNQGCYFTIEGICE